MKYASRAVLDTPLDKIDLDNWIARLSDAEYQATARGPPCHWRVPRRPVARHDKCRIGGRQPAHPALPCIVRASDLFHLVPLTVQIR